MSFFAVNFHDRPLNLAGDTAWASGLPVAPGMQRVHSAGRTAESAGPRRRNAQLRWAMRGQDPLFSHPLTRTLSLQGRGEYGSESLQLPSLLTKGLREFLG